MYISISIDIYKDDAVIHNNYKMINDHINEGKKYLKSNKLFFRVVF